jgi:hypothetical protein
MSIDAGDKKSTIFQGLSGFWQRFFKDAGDLEAYYQASEIYLGQVYLDLMASILNIGVVDTPIFNKEYWKLFAINENELNFTEGPSVSQDRYVYDMPGDFVMADFLQNTILEPDVLLERDVDFEIVNNDGLIRFVSNPFRVQQDADGNWMPMPGVAWRTVTIEVGNQLSDKQQTQPWEDGTDIKRGDILRLLGHRGRLLREGRSGTGTEGDLAYDGVGTWTFTATDVHLCNVGDSIEVFNAAGADAIFNGVYLVKSIVTTDKVTLERTGFIPVVSSAGGLSWKQFYILYFETFKDKPFRDYEIDYFENNAFVGSAAKPYPLDLNSPVVYSAVRNVANPQVIGTPVPFVFAGPSPILPPIPTFLGMKNLIPGTVVVFATKLSGSGPVVEGVDYSVDYWRGILYQILPWKDTSLGRCNYQYQEEVFLAANGVLSAKPSGNVKQISFWVPEVQVDRFNLWYNYGYLLNRFDASSEAYKSFLAGIMHLYISGPILERIESALNVAAGYPVVRRDGEVLTAYDSGVNASGSDGVLTAVLETFESLSFSFSELDLGGYIVISSPLSDINKGRFRILEVFDEHTVRLETTYGFVTETSINWVLSRTYTKTVSTTVQDYKYPYYVPIRADIEDPYSLNKLTFQAFEVLTDAFTVTDYIEDPSWWVNKVIPRILWDEAILNRRLATTLLYENIYGPMDDARYGDPGLFYGADENGNVLNPTDGLGNPVNLYRHSAAFLLFDRYFKLHMFFISFHPDLELTVQFKNDMEELILVAKPAYTYPYVEPGTEFDDYVVLDDILYFPRIGFFFGGDGDGQSDSLFLSNNELVYGDPNFPVKYGDYFKYDGFLTFSVPGAPGTVTPGYNFTIPLLAGTRPLVLGINATVGGELVLEGRDYTVNWLRDHVDAWKVTALTTWDPITPLTVSMEAVAEENLSTVPVPNTVVGWTPLMFGGRNPFYIRKGALDPSVPTYAADFSAVRSEQIDRPIGLSVNADTGVLPDGLPYIYD